MALYWPEARVAVRFSDAPRPEGDKDFPPEVLVVLMREGQPECAEFVEAVRDLVASRTMERRCRALDALYELGTLVPEPEGEEPDVGEGASKAQRAEARLREQLAGRGNDPGTDDEGTDEDLWGWERNIPAAGPLGTPSYPSSWGAPEPKVVINHCNEVVVGR